MSRMIRRMILAAAVGLFAAGAASAQQPMPSSLPVVYAPQSAAPAAQAQPKPLPPAASAPAIPVVVQGQPGCGPVAAPCASQCATGCDSCKGHKWAGVHARVAANPCTIGAGCANTVGCSSPASERTFLFGSCHQFFNPGNKCGGGHGFGGFLRGDCATGPIGTGIGSCGPCVYGSYLNR